MKKSVAVIGGGIAGLTAAYRLSRTCKVTLIEKSGRLGGNAYQISTHDGENLDIAVAVFGHAGYPRFFALLKELGIKTRPTLNSYLSMQSLESSRGLYLSPRPQGLLDQKFAVLKPQNLQSLWRTYRGLVKAGRLYDRDSLSGLTVGDLISQLQEFSGDSKRLLMCIFCLLSSMAAEEVLAAPAGFFMEKLKVHSDVLSPRSLYSVHCVDGGTKSYVDALRRGIRGDILLNSPFVKVLRNPKGIQIVDQAGHHLKFDKVVMACNADQALELLENPTHRETECLGAWKYKDGRVVVHRDLSSFPPRSMIEAYTFLYSEKNGVFQTSVNGALWREPQASKYCEYISAQHPNYPIRPELIEFETVLRTPVFDFDSTKTRALLSSLNGTKNTYYCGSYFGFGLHEDAIASAEKVSGGIY